MLKLLLIVMPFLLLDCIGTCDLPSERPDASSEAGFSMLPADILLFN